MSVVQESARRWRYMTELEVVGRVDRDFVDILGWPW